MLIYLIPIFGITLVLLFFTVQFVLSGKFLHWFLSRISKGYYKIEWNGGGLHFPWLYFRLENFRVFFHGKHNTDVIEITAREIRGRVSFTHLIRGRILIRHSHIIEPKGSYTNIQPSEEKIELLPRRNLVRIQNTTIEKGELYVEDRNLTPIYKILLSDIFVKNLNMDCGCPMSFLFQSEYGRCKIGEKGRLLVEKSDTTNGHLTLTGATWTDLAGLKIIPLPIINDRIDLRARFQNDTENDRVLITGTLRNSDLSDSSAQELLTNVESQATKDQASTFQLVVPWTEYALPFDIALRKLLLDLFHKLQIKGVVGFTIHSFTRGIVSIFTRS